MKPVNCHEPGEIIHRRYEIIERVARGSTGMVYKAREIHLDRLVAIKLLDLDAGLAAEDSEDEHTELFLSEATSLSRLRHPHTVGVRDFGIWDGCPYLVMEFVEGPTLREVLATGTMSPLRMVRIARQICESMSEAHARGLVHRDLRPGNVLISAGENGSDDVKVKDFALVREFGDTVNTTASTMLMGTPLYMAPEQIRSSPLDARCDIYAIGVLLYEGVSGRPPFTSSQTAETLTAHLNDPVPPLEVGGAEGIPEMLAWTIYRCLEKKPGDRFASTNELIRALRMSEAALLDPDVDSTLSMRLERGLTVVAEQPPERRALAPLLLLLVAGVAALLSGCVVTQGVRALWGIEAAPLSVPASMKLPTVPAEAN